MSESEFDEMLTTQEAARRLGCSPRSLSLWRRDRNVYLPYVKMIRKVMYKAKDVQALIDKNMIDPLTKEKMVK